VLPAGRAGEIAGNIENGPDADLIAAAPDMLAALRAVDDYFIKGAFDFLPITMVQAAIAKAEGRK